MKVVITLQGVRTYSPEPTAEKPRILNKEMQGEDSVRYSAIIRPGQVELLMRKLEAKIRHYRPDEVEIIMGIAPNGEFPVKEFLHAQFASLDKELSGVTSTLRACADMAVKAQIWLYYDGAETG